MPIKVMHIPFDPDSINWASFLIAEEQQQQSGEGYVTLLQQGGGGGALGYTYFEGIPYQRGCGIASIFRSLFRSLLPLGKQAASAVGREGLATAARVLQNAVQANSEDRPAQWKENVTREARAGASNLLGRAAEHLRAPQSGGRRQRPTTTARTRRRKPIKAPTTATLFSRKGPKPPARRQRIRVDTLGVY